MPFSFLASSNSGNCLMTHYDAGAPEMPRQQKSLWCIINVRHHYWLAWLIVGVSHEEDVSSYASYISGHKFFHFSCSSPVKE